MPAGIGDSAPALVKVPRLAGPAPRWSDLGKRALAALVLAPLALAAVWVGGIAFWLLAAVLTCGLTYEWTRLCRTGRHRAPLLAAGVIWIWLNFALLLALRGDPVVGRANVMFLLLLVWASDIGAYLAGRAIGGPRLAPRISPGKTWAGAAGGLAGAIAIGLLAAGLQPGTGGFARAAVIAAALSVIGQAGDLVESALKRRFGVKDSGRLIPGHGGLLDRLDAALAVIPVGALLAFLLGRGVVLW